MINLIYDFNDLQWYAATCWPLGSSNKRCSLSQQLMLRLYNLERSLILSGMLSKLFLLRYNLSKEDNLLRLSGKMFKPDNGGYTKPITSSPLHLLKDNSCCLFKRTMDGGSSLMTLSSTLKFNNASKFPKSRGKLWIFQQPERLRLSRHFNSQMLSGKLSGSEQLLRSNVTSLDGYSIRGNSFIAVPSKYNHTTLHEILGATLRFEQPDRITSLRYFERIPVGGFLRRLQSFRFKITSLSRTWIGVGNSIKFIQHSRIKHLRFGDNKKVWDIG